MKNLLRLFHQIGIFYIIQTTSTHKFKPVNGILSKKSFLCSVLAIEVPLSLLSLGNNNNNKNIIRSWQLNKTGVS